MTQLFIKQQGAGQPIVFLHGWGFNHSVWDSIVPLFPHNTLYQVDLPGHGQSPFCDYQLSHLTHCLTEQLPREAVWIAWSLGGLLAMATAIQSPNFIKALVLVSTSPRFVASENWYCAMKEQILRHFHQQLQQNITVTLQRFLALQVKDSTDSRQQLRYLTHSLKANGYPQLEALQAGLNLLLMTDLRAQLSSIQCPSLVILGQQDAIVPVSVGEQWQLLMPMLQVVPIKSAAHVPFLSHPTTFLQHIQRFFHDHNITY